MQIGAEAAGLGQVEEVLEVAMKSHGSDFHLDCVAADGETYRIALGVNIDSLTAQTR